MKEVSIELLKELENSQDFAFAMRAAKTEEDVREVLAEYGIELTAEEFAAGCEQAAALFEEKGYLEDGELTENGLDLVAGGLNTAVCGVGIGAGVGGLALMMSGPIGWGAVGLWAGGCALATCGLFVPGKKKRR